MFEIINNTNSKVEELNILEEYIKYVSKRLDIEKAIFNIILVNTKDIQDINKNYRNIDKPTDVISFALEDNSTFKNPVARMLGDIYICIPIAYEQAENYGHSRIREICFLATHGILHLLGYDHIKKEEEEIMFNLQEELLSDYEINR